MSQSHWIGDSERVLGSNGGIPTNLLAATSNSNRNKTDLIRPLRNTQFKRFYIIRISMDQIKQKLRNKIMLNITLEAEYA